MDDLELTVRIAVLENAIKYNGKPSGKSVMSALMGNRTELRQRAQEVKAIVEKVVTEVSSLTLEQQRVELSEIAPELVEVSDKLEEEEKELPPLPNLEKWSKIIMRLAPFPSGPLHIGNARMVILNDYYVKRYDGELILVFDDTIGSEEKVVEPDAYDLIPEGLDYLDVKCHRTIYKSDRLDLFYKYAVDLIERREAYVCDCDAEVWRTKHKLEMKACPCSFLSVEDNLARWERMLDGSYPERSAAVRLMTGMTDPDPAMRDHVILRISDAEHPRVGAKYRVWPLLEYSWGIDDHELGISHIIRGKDLVKEGKIEQHIWNIYGWPHSELMYYGRIRFQDAKLSKSKSRKEVLDGVYSGWDDPRTWSLQSLEKRGIHPDALRKAMLDLGLSVVDISMSMKPVYSENRKIRDEQSPRLFLVLDPVWLSISGLPTSVTEVEAPVHPDFPERGVRKIPLNVKKGAVSLGVSSTDFQRIDEGEVFRLKDLANFTMRKKKAPSALFYSLDVDDVRRISGPIIHWVPEKESIPIELVMIDGHEVEGVAEPSAKGLKQGTFLQFERVGFGKVFEDDPKIRVAFSHK
ncbi:MAG: glutamate--tRNA ligase [Candidatus Thorarchaeota archaeon]|nr:MAG: glutamate--tRNA ligase [Candidatus Thorarchaeota archaeon]